jgi:5'-AMP-activated protein kinase, regulatory beta subunit
MSSSVTFVWPYGGEKVELAGSFTGWKPVEMNPTDDRKRWQLPVELGGGRHEFKFVVDGRWVHDPEQPTEVSDVGTQNNVVSINDAAESRG